MLLFGTEMHIIILIFVLLEIAMYLLQFVYYFSRPQDKSWLWYSFLFFLLIKYNITSGVVPYPHLNIPLITQNIISHGSGFLIAAYFPYYFYKNFVLERLRFQDLSEVLIFLIIFFVAFFVVIYSINKNSNPAIKHGIIIPFFYFIVLILAILKAIRLKYNGSSNRANFIEVVSVYGALIPWASLTEISRSITKARIELDQLTELNICFARPLTSEPNCNLFQLTNKDLESIQFIRQSFKYKMIAECYFSDNGYEKMSKNIFS